MDLKKHSNNTTNRFNTSSSRNLLVLVDQHGTPIGNKDKMLAHLDGDLHSAFSIFVFNDKSELLLQRRDRNKYHSGGLWSNTCCSHPFPEENIFNAGQRRLHEEMGFICNLFEGFTTTYNVRCDDDFIEHEYNTVFIGHYSGEPNVNSEEVEAWKWMDIDELCRDINDNSSIYTSWFPLLLDDAINSWGKLRGENI